MEDHSINTGSHTIDFVKMHGTGNDFILVDGLTGTGALVPDEFFSKMARSMCDRRFGIGCDQLLLLRPSTLADFKMIIFNSDGSFASMCGNGARCAAALFASIYKRCGQLSMDTASGVVQAIVHSNVEEYSVYNTTHTVSVNLNSPKVVATDVPIEINVDGTNKIFNAVLVSVGNPHCVIFTEENLEDVPLQSWGRLLEVHPMFPDRTNVEFARVIGDNIVKMRVWERGAGETLSCGSGASAVAAAAIHTKRVTERTVTIIVPGGELRVKWPNENELWLEGPATYTYRGQITVRLNVLFLQHQFPLRAIYRCKCLDDDYLAKI